MELISLEKVWDKGGHNAFTDLCWFKQRLWLCFREGEGHVCANGLIRILSRSLVDDYWQEHEKVCLAGNDLRDPKLIVDEQGKLMLTCAGVNRSAAQPLHQSYLAWSDDGEQWTPLKPVGDMGKWLWRSRQLNDAIYGVAYSRRLDRVDLYRLDNEGNYQPHVSPLFSYEQNGLGYPNEHDLCLMENGKAWCLLRRDADNGSAQLGCAMPPYKDWQWQDLNLAIGGPVMLKLQDGRILCAVRLYDPVRTSLCYLDVDKPVLEEVLALPSGGDTSYAGLVEQNNRIYCAYYSSHEECTSIYLAELSL